MSGNEPFQFYTERRLIALTGVKAANLAQLLTGLREVSGSSIFYHTHHQYLAQHFEKPRFYNDFAMWAWQALQEERLAEELAAIDLLMFTTIRKLREAIAEIIERRLGEAGGLRDCREGNEFHFCKSKSFILPTGVLAHDVPELFARLQQATNASVYFHFFEARLRLGEPTNDFSRWLRGRGENELAAAVERLDPYVRTLDELKQDIASLGGDRARQA